MLFFLDLAYNEPVVHEGWHSVFCNKPMRLIMEELFQELHDQKALLSGQRFAPK